MDTMNFDKDTMRQNAAVINDGDVLTMGPDDALSVGLSWDVSSEYGAMAKRVGCDLDAGATLLQGGEPVLMAWLETLDPAKDRSIVHTGDNKTGEGDGDDETLNIQNFRGISPEFDSVIFFAANYKKPSMKTKLLFKGKVPFGFHAAEAVKMTLYTSSGGDHQAFSIRPSLLTDDNVCLVVRADRVTKGDPNSDWHIRKINKMTTVPQGDKRALLRAAMTG